MKKSVLILVISFMLCSFMGNAVVTAEEVVNNQPDWNFVDWSKLDVGIYWFDKDNQPYKSDNPKAPFDPKQPTVIFAHGFQEGSVKEMRRQSFYYKGHNTVKAWRADGWNVGVFYWNQLADEGEVKNAEAKIWTSNFKDQSFDLNLFGGRKDIGMRWKKTDGSFTTEGITAGKNVGDLFYEEYVEAMKDYQGSNIRIAGLSLGNQLAVRLTNLVDKNIEAGNIEYNLLPTRVALLDPFYSRYGKDYLNGQWVGEVVRKKVSKLIAEENVIFEFYKSSVVTGELLGDSNWELRDMTATVEMKPWFTDRILIGDEIVDMEAMWEKHEAPFYLYFLSYGNDIGYPAEIVDNKETGNRVLSAITNDLRTASMMGDAYKWVQEGDDGSYTIDTNDDLYERQKKSSYKAVEDLSLEGEIKLAVGKSTKIESDLKPQDATHKIIVWEVENPKIARVDGPGVIKGLESGTTKVHAMIQNLKTGEIIEDTAAVTIE